MIAKLTHRVFALFAAVAVVLFTADAMAQCASCGTAAYSVGYAAPVAYQASYAPVAYTTAYAPTYTTAYAPAYSTYSSGWYPGYWLGRVNRSIWGYPTTTYYAPAYTASYAPTYTASYAPAYSTVSYAPACSSCAASYAPVCSTCTAGYAPACSTCSTCGVSYAPACSSCSACDSCASSVSTCASCASGTVSQAVYQEPAAAPAATTYSTQGTTTPSTERQPTLDPNQNVPAERTPREADKPLPAESPTLEPEPKADSDGSATNLQAPQLFDPNDRTAQRHMAPVWTAVYHTTSGAEPAAQPVAWQQIQQDAEGWSSVAD